MSTQTSSIRRPNERLATLMVELGVANKRLARAMREYSEQDGGLPVAPSHTTIARYLNGAIRPNQRSRDVLVKVLSNLSGRTLTVDDVGYVDERSAPGAGGDNAGSVLQPLGFPSLPHDAVDPDFVGHLVNILSEHVRMDALTGPRYVIGALRAELALVEELCGKARGALRPSLLEAGARFCEFAGWLFQDSGDLRSALYWSNRAMDYAEELGDAHLTSYVLMRRSNIATESGYAAQGLGLANAALRRSSELTPELRAVALRQRANAYALTGEEGDCRRALDEAMVEVLSIDEDAPNRLATYCTPSYIEMEAAHSWVRMGRGDRAIETYTVGLSDWPKQQRRDKGLCAARLSSVHASMGEFEAAGRTGLDALNLVRSAPSARSLAVLRDVSRVMVSANGEVVTQFKVSVAELG